MQEPKSTNSSMLSMDEIVRRPKVFISYSWTSPGHQAQVRQWSERLLQDGIQVILDIFDLKEGHDKYAFMEKMVTDPTVTHVLVICDEAYSRKADAKTSGVGVESQIISREVYERVEQSKFIPIVCQFKDEREPFLPIFLKSRLWIDFSSMEATNENWEKLVRALYGKPLYQKPELGAPPIYITADIPVPSSPAIAKFSTFKQALLQGKPGLSIYRRDFLSACVKYADALRIRQKPEADSFGPKILQDCGDLKNVRNQIVDWVLLESGITKSEEFCDSVLQLLEDIRELKSRPPELNSWNDAWFEAHSVFVYETFLYVIAALLKTGAYQVLHEVFKAHYLRPESERYSNAKFEKFGCFLGHSDALQSVLAEPGRRLLSPAAALINRQADREDVPFSAVMEAELLVFLMAMIDADVRWYPQTLLYNSQAEFPFFVRSIRHRHFLKLATITGIANADELRETAKLGYQRLGVERWHDFMMTVQTFWGYMNMDQLDSLG